MLRHPDTRSILVAKVSVINDPVSASTHWRFSRYPKAGDVISRRDKGLLYRVIGLRDSFGNMRVERFERGTQLQNIIGWDGPVVEASLNF